MQQPLLQEQNNLHLDTPMLLNWHDQLPLLSYHLFQSHEHVVNVISTRLGGVSESPYDTLNLALSTPDNPQSVLENRRRLCRAAGVALEDITIGQLVQGLNIAVVTEEIRGRGALDRAAALQGTDGLLTNLRNAPLAVLVADCTVVSYYDPKHEVIALAHAGWRGTAGLIASSMVTKMHEVYGSNPEDILIGIGPNMAKDNFQVRGDVLQAFQASFGDQTDTFFAPQSDGSFLLDLNAALIAQLLASGIQEEHMEIAGIDTYARTDVFYSHRAEKGKAGRFCGLIALR
ncbi:laccase domain protein [Dictyobacter alpinus]|uniref:Purine nucleoside phosphorylase n=1 Tax=Dictyobacter alpinus TaxID=2014873 RepID=A0A402BL69_9CHLR|nr:peptidoglycan editing factor PgeF [Dictyobacter alpinus]GCE32069.1 laccase domain protein [Dictyobacter alpinus]